MKTVLHQFASRHSFGCLWAAALIITLQASPASAQERVVGWHNSLESAQQSAAESRKPIFAVFRCVR